MFNDLPLGDVWFDAGCHKVFFYLWNCRDMRTGCNYIERARWGFKRQLLHIACRIPPGWEFVLKAFHADLLAEVAWLLYMVWVHRSSWHEKKTQVARLEATQESQEPESLD